VKGKKRKCIVGGNGIFKVKMDEERLFFIDKEVTQWEVLSEQTKRTGGFPVFLG
jgi:hypothetical protein